MTKGSWLFNKRSPLAGECRHHHNSCVCRSPFFIITTGALHLLQKDCCFCLLRMQTAFVWSKHFHTCTQRKISLCMWSDHQWNTRCVWRERLWIQTQITRLTLQILYYTYLHQIMQTLLFSIIVTHKKLCNYFESLLLSALFILIDDGSCCGFFIHLLFTLNFSFHRIINWLSKFGSVIALLFDAYAGRISHRKSRAIQQYIETYTGI